VARYYQLLLGHTITVPYLKNKPKKRDSHEYLWWNSRKRQTREHLFKESERWKVEIRELWRRVGKEIRWRGVNFEPLSKLFREEHAEEVVLEFIRRMGVGKSNEAMGRIAREESSAESEEETES
jgi:hypothetical protein